MQMYAFGAFLDKWQTQREQNQLLIMFGGAKSVLVSKINAHHEIKMSTFPPRWHPARHRQPLSTLQTRQWLGNATGRYSASKLDKRKFTTDDLLRTVPSTSEGM